MSNIIFAGFGEVNTPVEVLESKCSNAASKLKELGAELVECFPIVDDYEGTSVNNALDKFSDIKAEVLIVCIAGWIPSHTVIKVTEKYRHLPIILWGLCGWLDGKKVVTTADQAGTTALRKTFEDLEYKYTYLYDTIDGISSHRQVFDICQAVKAANLLRNQKIGHMGFRDMHLYNTLYDGVTLKKAFGVEIEFFEMLEVVQRAEKVTSQQKLEVINLILEKWTFLKQCQQESLEKTAAYYLAIKQIAHERGYTALSLKDVDGMKKLLGFPPAPIFMLLSNEDNISTIPENDALGNLTQLLIRAATGRIGAYLEFYEFFKDGVLAGVPDYIPAEITDGNITVMPAAFGALSEGILNVSSIKEGEITLSRIGYTDGKYYLHIVSGIAKRAFGWEECGWAQPAPQLPGIKILLEDTESFAQQVLGQHYIIAYGNTCDNVVRLCKQIGIEVVR